MAKESLRELAKNLNDQIAKIRSEVDDVSMQIEEHLKSKTDAREQYDRCLNAGDQVGMGACLGAIKKANKEIEVLSSKFEVFSQKALALHESHKEMKVVGQRDVKECAAALKAAKKLKERCDAESNICLGALTQLSELQKVIGEESRKVQK